MQTAPGTVDGVGREVEIKGFLKALSDPNRKAVAITEGQDVDYGVLSGLLKQAFDSL